MQVGVLGAAGAVGQAVTASLAALGLEAVAVPRGAGVGDEVGLDACVLAVPVTAWPAFAVPSIGAAVRPTVARGDAAASATVPAAGWWGGLGTLLAAVAAGESTRPREVHVAYGLPGNRRALRSASPTLRDELVGLVGDEATARTAGQLGPEPLAEGRRLAWFPRPVGPAHAAAVGGFEVDALPTVPTVRTWVAAGSLQSELLQAVGRSAPDGVLARTLTRRWRTRPAAAGGTADVRWALVVEALGEDGQLMRSWANGTDPVAATGALLAVGARRLALGAATPTGTVLDLGEPAALLDELADLGVLRWSVARPEQPRG